MTDKTKILAVAKKRMCEAYDADQTHRERALDDMRFAVGEQWRDEDRAAREADGKPCLTMNSMPQFLRKVTAQIRNMNPAIRVSAGDGDASPEVAEIIEGLIRQIEHQSEAASIYEAAAETAAACGIGHWRVLTDYAEGLTFDQEIVIKPIRNPFSVFWDPFAKEPTRKDARYCFVAEDMPTEDFKAAYPDAQAENITDANTPAGIWTHGDKVTVAEYFWIEENDVKIGLLPDGSVVRDPRPPMQFVAERTVKEPKVMWAKISGQDVLEGPKEVAGRHIPVVAVVGEEWNVGEETYRSSVIRFAKDAQVLYNYARSVGAELMGMQPKAPFLVTTKQIAGLEDHWAGAGQANMPYLVYTPDPMAPPPQRMQPAIPSPAVMTEIQLAGEDMKRTTGIYDASLGAKSNETSGVAIAQRQQESEASTSSYADNMVKAVAHTGRIIVSMIPKVYDAQRVVRILGEDSQEKLVKINSLIMTDQGPQPVNDVTIGKYDVRIGVGPSYQTKREESATGMMEFMRVVPQAAPLVADLVAGMQDWAEADRVAERLRKTLPPGMAGDDEQPSPEQAQQMQMQAMQQQQAMQMQQQAAMLDLQERQAKAQQATAQAEKAMAEAEKAKIELAQMVAQMNAGAMPRAPFGAVNPQGF